MLAIPGKNPLGNVLHLVVGPESELVMDMEGSCIMEISALLNKFDTQAPVFVSITRSRSEAQTSASLKQAGVPHMGVVSQVDKCDGNCEACGTDKPKTKAKPKVQAKADVCDYCHNTVPLMPVPGKRICASCTQIELGLKSNKQAVKKDTPDAHKDTTGKAPGV